MATIATIDFEASSLNGHPIEVGVAIYDADRCCLSVWSSLIRPTRSWLQTMEWDPDAEQLHGISLNELADAPTAFDVARQLNHLLGPVGAAYCDGWEFDVRWLQLLMAEAPEETSFQLLDRRSLAQALGLRRDALFVEQEKGTKHRAADDAEGLLLRGLELAGRNLRYGNPDHRLPKK